MDISKDIFQVALEFGDATRSEWEAKSTGGKEEHFEAWYFDGEKRVPSTLNILRSLPHEALMTYFKDDKTVKPQGTIPLKDCSIDLPNDMRKSFALKSRKEVDGFEIRITHMSRRPFLLVFASDIERREWVKFLTTYIAHTFLSEQFLLAEKVAAAEDGIYVTKLSSTTGTTSTSIATPSDGKKRYLYIDWFSTDVKDWCLKYSAMKLAIIVDGESGNQMLANLPSSSIAMQSILSIDVDAFPSSDIIIELPASTVEFSPVSGSRESALAWCRAANAALKLQEISMPTAPANGRPTMMKRNSTKRISDLRNMLQAPVEPTGYTRDDFLRERRSMNTKIDALAAMPPPISVPLPLPPAALASASLDTSTAPTTTPLVQRSASAGPSTSTPTSNLFIHRSDSVPEKPTSRKNEEVLVAVTTDRMHRASEPASKTPTTYSSDTENRRPLARGSSLRRFSSMGKSLLTEVLGTGRKLSNADEDEEGNSTASDSGIRRGTTIAKTRRLSSHGQSQSFGMESSNETAALSSFVGANTTSAPSNRPTEQIEEEPQSPDISTSESSFAISIGPGRTTSRYVDRTGSLKENDQVDSTTASIPAKNLSQKIIPGNIGQGRTSDRESVGGGYDSGASRRSGRSGQSAAGRESSRSGDIDAPHSQSETEMEKHSVWRAPCVSPEKVTLVVEYKTAIYLLAVCKEGMSIHSLREVGALDAENDDQNVMKMSLDDCLGADIDLNGSGLIRLVLRSRLGEQTGRVQWVVRSKAGHPAALDWIKALRLLKQNNEVDML